MQKIFWKVVYWKWKWKSLWFPTANISLNLLLKKDEINHDIFLYSSWVYKINIIIDWKKYSWAWFISMDLLLCEAHIFDFNQNIYWKEIEIILLKKIRDIQKFDSSDSLINQIKKDIENIKKIKLLVITFWTFDKLHKWHEYYLFESSKYWDILITIIWRDDIVKKIKWKFPFNNEQKRLTMVKLLWFSDIVELWDLNDQYFCIKKYLPEIICLWYDQDSFSKWLWEFLLKINHNSDIVRLKSFLPEIYKSSLIENIS